MEPELRFELLGTLRAFAGPDGIDLGPAKQRAVLAVLLLHPGKPVATHRIVDAVWGDDPPENGANVVQKYVAGLRRVLGRERVALSDGGYLLAIDPEALDTEVFRAELTRAEAERLNDRPDTAIGVVRDALALWHGEALGGLTGPVFEAARRRLAEERAGAWELWAELRLARGDQEPGLVTELTRLVAEFPLREGLRAHLMVALHRNGRQAEALAVFRDAREYFLDEIGAEPGELMQDVHRRILRGELEPPPPPMDFVQRASAALPPAPAPLPVMHLPAVPIPYPASPYPSSPPYPASPFPNSHFPASPGPAVPSVPFPGAPYPGAPLPAEMLRQPADRIRWLEMLTAALLPFITCSLLSWGYFVWAAIQRGRWWHWLIAAGYFLVLLTAIVLFFFADMDYLDANYVPTDDLSRAEELATAIFFTIMPVAAIHGIALAATHGDTRSARIRRELARQVAASNPGAAVRSGIGRPDLVRFFDDGGLVDLNHVSAGELSRLPGISTVDAHRIGMDRYQNGPYREPGDLLRRGLLTRRKLRRISKWLIFLPPVQPIPAVF